MGWDEMDRWVKLAQKQAEKKERKRKKKRKKGRKSKAYEVNNGCSKEGKK